MKKFKVGDKINNEYLGRGIVRKTYSESNILVVEFEKNPADKYNGGQNPCLVFDEDCKKLEEK